MMHLHVLPVNSNNLSFLNVSDCWHLEWEQLLIWRSFELRELVDITVGLITGDEVVVLAELAIESTYDHELTFGQLAHTSTLPGRDHVVWVLGLDPFPFVVEIGVGKLHSFKRSRVLFVGILDSTENIYKFIIEIRTRMIMTPFINLRKLHPLVDFGIVNFNSALGLVDFLSRSGHQNVSVSYSAA